jgi:PIN domain nuclease of toxin-antitoxin system
MPTARSAGDPSPIVLDTHVWIWVLEGARGELSDETIERIEEASGHVGIGVAAISVWEVAILEAKGRISLSRSLNEWVAAGLAAPGIRLVDLSPAISLDSARLPGDAPRDPADRMIIATARALGGTLVTRDEEILRYGANGHVRIRNAMDRS